MRMGLGIVGLMMALTLLVAPPAQAQQQSAVKSDILVLDPDKLFTESKLGQRINREYLADREELIARNRKIESELEAEELELTRLRAEKTPEEFRDLADAFDAKVQEIRLQSERAVRELERKRDRAPIVFMRIIEPVLVSVLQESGGAIILDVRSVLLRSEVVDITDQVIARIDAEIGEGLGPQAPATEPEPEPEPDPQDDQPASEN